MRLIGEEVRAALAGVFGNRIADRLPLGETVDDREVGAALLRALAPALTGDAQLSLVIIHTDEGPVRLSGADAHRHPDLRRWLAPTFAECLADMFVAGSQEQRSAPRYGGAQISQPEADDSQVRALVNVGLDPDTLDRLVLFYGPAEPATYSLSIAVEHLVAAGREARQRSAQREHTSVPKTRRRTAAGEAVH